MSVTIGPSVYRMRCRDGWRYWNRMHWSSVDHRWVPVRVDAGHLEWAEGPWKCGPENEWHGYYGA